MDIVPTSRHKFFLHAIKINITKQINDGKNKLLRYNILAVNAYTATLAIPHI